MMADEQDERDERAQLLETLRAPLLYSLPGMEAATAQRDIRYRGAAASDLRMDVYAPLGAQTSERRPAVLFIHGGPIGPLPLAPTEWGVYRGYGALAAASGWVGVTFAHRFAGFDQLDVAGGDIAAAIAYVRDYAADLGADRDRLCLWAFSGGGPFLADALRERPAYIRCLVAYYAVMDLRPLSEDEEIAPSVMPETLRRYSPLAAIEGATAPTPPMLLGRAGHDHPDLNAQMDAFIQAALAANMPLDLLNHPDGVHAFDTRTDDARTHEIISHTLAFLHERLDAR